MIAKMTTIIKPTPDISSNKERPQVFIGWPWYPDIVKNHQKVYSETFPIKILQICLSGALP